MTGPSRTRGARGSSAGTRNQPEAAIHPIVRRKPGFQDVMLEPGDVLLSLGTGDVSRAIKTLDGGKYSHAALWTGSSVIESTTPCVVERSLDESIAQHAREYVDVYRHRRIQHRAQNVLGFARDYLGRRYGYGDLLLLGVLVATSTWLPTRRSQVAFLLHGCKLNQLLGLDREAAAQLVTCTELVARAFVKAGVALRVRIGTAGRLEAKLIASGVAELAHDAKRGADDGPEVAVEWRQLQRTIAGKLAELGVEDFQRGAAVLRDSTPARRLVALGDGWSPNLVTPRQLEKSPDLKFCGRLYVPASPALRSPA